MALPGFSSERTTDSDALAVKAERWLQMLGLSLAPVL
jgi:hypothetical protein